MSILLPILAFVFAALIIAAPAYASRRARHRDRSAGLPKSPDPPSGEERGPTIRSSSMRSGVRFESSEVRRARWERSAAPRAGRLSWRRSDPYFYGIRMAIAIGAFVLFATPHSVPAQRAVGLGGSLLGYVLPGIVLGAHGEEAQAPDAAGAARCARPAGGQRRGRPRPRPGIQRVADELAFAHPDLSRRAEAGQPRAARRQGAHGSAAQPRRSHRRRGRRVAGRRCSCRPTSSARASRNRCASTRKRCGRSVASGRKKRRRRPA